MAFSNVSAFPYTMGTLSNVSPLTYRDSSTFLEELEQLNAWLTEVYTPETNVALANAIAEFQEGILNAETVITENLESWDSRFVAFMANVVQEIKLLNEAAVGEMVTDIESVVHDNLLALINAEIVAVANAYTDTTVTAAIDALPKQEYGYLVSAFTGNGLTNEKLSVFYSPDGKTVFGGGGNMVYSDPNVGLSLRDPSTLKIGNTFYVAHTVNNGYSKNFAIIRSTDLLNWSPVALVDVSSIPTLVQAWAPELVQDTNGDVYAFFTSQNAGGGTSYRVKALTANLSSWTAPSIVDWTVRPANMIDPAFIKKGNDWYMFYRNVDAAYIERAKSTTGLTGTYTTDRTFNWAGWGGLLEGPTVINTSTGYRFYADRYDANAGLAWSDSPDLDNWTPLTGMASSKELLAPEQRLRHGSVVKLDAVSAATVMGAALSNRPGHAEFGATWVVAANTGEGCGDLAIIPDNAVPSVAGHSVNVGQFVAIPARHQLEFVTSGYYSVTWTAAHDGTPAGANAYMAIRIPGAETVDNPATVDIPATSGAATVTMAPRYFKAGTKIQFACQFGNIMDLKSRVTVHKH